MTVKEQYFSKTTAQWLRSGIANFDCDSIPRVREACTPSVGIETQSQLVSP
jgi:hypothetical protein